MSATTSVEYGSINSSTGAITWNGTTTALPAGRWNHKVAVGDGYMYLTAGCTAGTLGACTKTGDVLYASINGNGTINGWTTRSNRITTNRFDHGFIVRNGYGYVAGGLIDNSLGTTTSVQYLQFNNDGTVPDTNWSAGTALPVSTYGNQVLSYSNYLYNFSSPTLYYMDVSGGAATGSWTTNSETIVLTNPVGNGGSFFNNGYFYQYDDFGGTQRGRYAKVNIDGSVSGVSDIAPPGFARDIHDQVVVSNGYVYFPGGCDNASGDDCNTVTTTVNFAPINNGGAGISSWTASTNLNTARAQFGSVAMNGYLYAIGGCTALAVADGSSCRSITATVEYASINPGGSLGSWATTTSLPTAVYVHPGGALAYNGYIYIVAGCNSVKGQLQGGGCNSTTAKIQVAKPNSNGTITSWDSTTNTAPSANDSFSVTAYNGYMYILGGALGSTVKYATVSSTTGNLGSWVDTSSLQESLDVAGNLPIYNGYIYTVASRTTGLTPVNHVEYAQINSDGTLGSWSYTTSTLKTHYSAANFAYNGFLYTYAGIDGQNSAYAPILANGKIGTWSNTSGVISTNCPQFPGSATYNGVIYRYAGSPGTSTSYCNDSQYSILQSIPRVGRYSRLLDCEADCTPTKLLTRGTSGGTDSVVSNSYACATNSSPTFGSTTTSTVTLSGLLTIPYQIKRYCFINYTLDDTLSAVFPDSSSTQTTLSDFNLYYHAASSRRLRGGKTFTGGNQQSLDAQP